MSIDSLVDLSIEIGIRSDSDRKLHYNPDIPLLAITYDGLFFELLDSEEGLVVSMNFETRIEEKLTDKLRISLNPFADELLGGYSIIKEVSGKSPQYRIPATTTYDRFFEFIRDFEI